MISLIPKINILNKLFPEILQITTILLIFFNSFLFTQTNHPIAIGIILLCQTLLTCVITGLVSKNFWFSYILFLILIGGILILFIYISSLASNEKINFTLKPLIKLIIFVNLRIIIFLFADKFYLINWFFNEEINYSLQLRLINENYLSLSKIYNQPNNWIIILLISYLLLTLIIVVKITNLFIGPLRPKSH